MWSLYRDRIPQTNLILLDMIDFDTILGINYLAPHHAVLDCYAKTITLAYPWWCNRGLIVCHDPKSDHD